MTCHMISTHQPPIQPGFLAFHSNRSENLAEVVINWLQRHPLSPLEEEVILVQSNGMAEWVKMELARMGGVCAATRVELPSRFLWRTYRQVLGREAVPNESPLDKVPMVWRLMQLLPSLIAKPAFSPVAGFLVGDEPDRMLQLASKLADLFDQYQNYRADWLQEWALGYDGLILADGTRVQLPKEQAWQPQLWRAVLQTLDETQRISIRPQLQRRVVKLLSAGAEPATPVASRVVVFGMSQIPMTTMQALAAISIHSQVLLAIPNPCQYYWGDIMDGRELLNAKRRRQPLRQGRELSVLPLEDMHAHAHPLLAAWGRQGRDFIRQLDHFDDAERAKQQFELGRIDLFDTVAEDTETPLLLQVQNRIRDLVPLAEHSTRAIDSKDQSVVFHSAHSPIRELEVLHDQLLHLLANPKPGTALKPRDIVVMLPDIERVAPSIRAVFGQYKRVDARFIPFDIADLSAKSDSPLISAVDWLLRLPAQRCRMSELVDLLEVVAVAQRFGISEESLPKLSQWMAGAGIRWGLNDEHRTDLGLGACGDQNSAWFGLRRMLLGYASGAVPVTGHSIELKTIEPYAEVGGLEAELAGSLAHLLQALVKWWTLANTTATPAIWAERCRNLLLDIFKCTSDPDKQALRALQDGLIAWQDACDQSGFTEEVSLVVARSAWLDAVETPSLNQRFRAGGVTFCTLMPMRAIPFEVVCLLGMNDGDYPRRGTRSDFDLMGLPGNSRPGDRSRREDDRQLMLEALLSARQVFYVSWCGNSVRDNSEQPASVLVSQLRDYLSAGWGKEVVTSRTTNHPLQPFSRQYFEEGSSLLTYAREWRSAHSASQSVDTLGNAQGNEQSNTLPAFEPMATFLPEPNVPLTLERLTQFLRNPVKAFFKQRLQVVFDEAPDEDTDDESFGVDALQQYGLLRDLLVIASAQPNQADEEHCVTESLAKLRRSGDLPLKVFGDIEQEALKQTLTQMLGVWHTEQAAFPNAAVRQSVRFEEGSVVLEDWIDHLRSSDSTQQEEDSKNRPLAWLELQPSNLLSKGKRNVVARPEKLLGAWVRCLVIAASGAQVQGIMVGRDGVVRIPPYPQEHAASLLKDLLGIWLAGMNSPLPLPPKTALAFIKNAKPTETYEGGHMTTGEVKEPCLERMYPDYEALIGDVRFEELAHKVYDPLLEWSKNLTVKAHAALEESSEVEA